LIESTNKYSWHNDEPGGLLPQVVADKIDTPFVDAPFQYISHCIGQLRNRPEAEWEHGINIIAPCHFIASQTLTKRYAVLISVLARRAP